MQTVERSYRRVVVHIWERRRRSDEFELSNMEIEIHTYQGIVVEQVQGTGTITQHQTLYTKRASEELAFFAPTSFDQLQ